MEGKLGLLLTSKKINISNGGYGDVYQVKILQRTFRVSEERVLMRILLLTGGNFEVNRLTGIKPKIQYPSISRIMLGKEHMG